MKVCRDASRLFITTTTLATFLALPSLLFLAVLVLVAKLNGCMGYFMQTHSFNIR